MEGAIYNKGIERLLVAVQELSMARSLEMVMLVVRKAARELTGADGATFVLREGDFCYYADEDAISPLWKGQRFPIHSCVSGHAMIDREAIVLKDIYADTRILENTYSPTFVKSLLMVPIRTKAPVGAIGNYWAQTHTPSPAEISLLQSLADITAVSIENVNVYRELEKKLKERTEMLSYLSEQNKQLEEFCYIISHNLRAPLSNLLLLGNLVNDTPDIDGKLMYIEKQLPVIEFLHETFEQLVNATQTRMDFDRERTVVKFDEILQKVVNSLQGDILDLSATVAGNFTEVASAWYPKQYLDSILLNLVHNALQYHRPGVPPKIQVRSYEKEGWVLLQVEDNGLGIDLEKNNDKLFKLGKTFHNNPNAKGFGLYITKTQIEAAGGKIWAESTPGKGSIFTIQLAKTIAG